jgi:hypothetical protein
VILQSLLVVGVGVEVLWREWHAQTLTEAAAGIRAGIGNDAPGQPRTSDAS